MDDKYRNTFYEDVGTRFLKGIMFIVCNMIDSKLSLDTSQELEMVDIFISI